VSIQFEHQSRQAALHGLLKKARDLGMPLVSVIPVKLGQAEAADVKE